MGGFCDRRTDEDEEELDILVVGWVDWVVSTPSLVWVIQFKEYLPIVKFLAPNHTSDMWQSDKNVPTCSCYFFPDGANFLAKHAKNCATLSILFIVLTPITVLNIIKVLMISFVSKHTRTVNYKYKSL